ncbi:MAG: hypothetical protein COA78_06820 [Blastopirellula sp.]|nr:MAG: hypothetical protein COA78_06820 [Blastopirellula sp.]
MPTESTVKKNRAGAPLGNQNGSNGNGKTTPKGMRLPNVLIEDLQMIADSKGVSFSILCIEVLRDGAAIEAKKLGIELPEID